MKNRKIHKREMKRNTLIERVKHIHTLKKTQAGLMMVPPPPPPPPLLSESMAMVSPNNTGRQRHMEAMTQPRLIKHKFFGYFFFLFCLFLWRGSASEDQTYQRPPVTHHHYISAQYHHIPEVTLSRGNKRRMGGKKGGGTSLL